MKNRLQRLLPPSPVLLSVPACPQALTNLPPPRPRACLSLPLSEWSSHTPSGI